MTISKILYHILSVALYGTGIRYDISEKGILGNALNRLKKIFSVIFASIIFLVEETQNYFVCYKISKKIQLLAEKQDTFKLLSSEERGQVKEFYNAKIRELDKAQKLICREATIQVVLQLSLILYQESLMNHLSLNFELLLILWFFIR